LRAEAALREKEWLASAAAARPVTYVPPPVTTTLVRSSSPYRLSPARAASPFRATSPYRPAVYSSPVREPYSYLSGGYPPYHGTYLGSSYLRDHGSPIRAYSPSKKAGDTTKTDLKTTKDTKNDAGKNDPPAGGPPGADRGFFGSLVDKGTNAANKTADKLDNKTKK
jgi:hypothetical protein